MAASAPENGGALDPTLAVDVGSSTPQRAAKRWAWRRPTAVPVGGAVHVGKVHFLLAPVFVIGRETDHLTNRKLRGRLNQQLASCTSNDSRLLELASCIRGVNVANHLEALIAFGISKGQEMPPRINQEN